MRIATARRRRGFVPAACHELMILTAFTGIALAVAVGLWSGNRTIVGAHQCAIGIDEAVARAERGDSYTGMCPVSKLALVRGEKPGEVCCSTPDIHGGEEGKFCGEPGTRLAEKHPLPGRSKRLYTLAAEIVAGILVVLTVGLHITRAIAMRK